MSLDLNDERLRRAYAAPAELAGAVGDCPPDEEIWAASRGELAGERAEALLQHAASCASCGESWKMAQALGREVPATESPPASRGIPRWIGLAAAAVGEGDLP